MKKTDRSTDDLSKDAFFQTVFQASPDAAVLTRVCDGKIIHVNDGFCRVTGYTQEEVIGKTTLELALYENPSDRNKFLNHLKEHSTLEPRTCFFRRKNGVYNEGLVSARSFCSQGIEYVCVSIRDVTEQQRIDQENNARAEELNRLFESMSQGVLYQDIQGNILCVNPAAERIFGLPAGEMQKRSSRSAEWKLVREDGSVLPVEEYPSSIALRTGKPFGPYTLGVSHAQKKEYIWTSVTATPLFHDGEKTPFQVYVIMEDISAQRKAQQDYQLLFQKMVDAFALHEIITDSKGRPKDYRFLAVNPAFEKLTGLCADDLIGKTVLDILPETESYWINIYGNVAATGESVTFQNYSVSLKKHFSVTAYRTEPMQFACTFTDITNQIQYQQETQKAQEEIRRLAHICDVAPSSIIVVEESGKILYVNDYAAQLHGYSKEELRKKWIYDLSMGSTDASVREKFHLAHEVGELVIKKTVLGQNGTQIPLLINAKPIEWDGQPAILSIGTDLTEQLKTEKTLRISLAQNRRILENLQDGFFQVNMDGEFILVNPRMAQIFGYDSVEDMLQVNIQLMYTDPEERAKLLVKLAATGSLKSQACLVRRKDGSLIWISMNAQYLRNEAGEIIGTEGLIRDINERRKLEQELQRQHAALIATNEVLIKRLEQSINAISKMGELRDAYTAGHQRRVQQLACEIGQRCGMTQESIVNLSYGALIHDIGKIYIASDILNKPGKITNLEYQILQTHAEYSYNIVREMDLPQEILTMVLQHHERLDGSGYPNKIQGDEIILESRILAVSDVVEAMTSHRPYRPALGIDAALAEIESGKGTKYDANVVDICISLFREQGFVFALEQDQY
ncbi:MAG: PAS domain S-box protein [Eubacteriales bacterium]|nr:PAS domain S-box protein [Eubacteriales bacterium]